MKFTISAPEISIAGAEMIIPLVCIGIFFLLVFGFLVWFFIAMNRGDERSQARQEKMYRSPPCAGWQELWMRVASVPELRAGSAGSTNNCKST